MKERLQEFALIAEIVSAVAIVVSLIFVGFQIRENTTSNYALSYDQLLAATIEWNLSFANNPDTMAAFQDWVNSEDPSTSLDSIEADRGARIAQSIGQLYERAYFARFYGRLADNEWARYHRRLCTFFNSAQIAPKIDDTMFSPELLRYASEECGGD